MKQLFKDIPGYEGLYQVSSDGIVRSLDRETKSSNNIAYKFKSRELSGYKDKRGYISVRLSKQGHVRTFKVHVLQALAFLNHKPQGNKLVVDHINNVPWDNRIDNLQIITHRENLSKDKRNCTSKFTGVSWHKRSKKWLVHIFKDGKVHHVGLFRDERKAAQAYQDELQKINQL